MKANKIIRLIFAVVLISVSLSVAPNRAEANPMREFVMSCTYGVLAGTLVGAATLAFEDQPGDNLNKIARGASLGLYAGIMLGLYVVYIVPGQANDLQEEGLPPAEDGYSSYRIEPPRLNVYPLLSDTGTRVEGMAANYTLLKF